MSLRIDEDITTACNELGWLKLYESQKYKLSTIPHKTTHYKIPINSYKNITFKN
jgi:hypothetical protein